MKNVVFIVLFLITVSLLGLVLHVGQRLEKANKSLEEERYSRMVAEETLQKDAGKLATLYAQLKDTQNKMAKIQEALSQEKNTNADLKKEYEQLDQTKQQLQNALQTKQNQATQNSQLPVTQDMEGK